MEGLAEAKRLLGVQYKYILHDQKISKVEIELLSANARYFDEWDLNICLYIATKNGNIRLAQTMINHGATNFKEGLHVAVYFKQHHAAYMMNSKGANEVYYSDAYEEYTAWRRCVLALPILCEDVLRMVT